MNMKLDVKTLAALAIDSGKMLERIGHEKAASKHGAPFAKTAKGKARRDARKRSSALKRGFLNARYFD